MGCYGIGVSRILAASVEVLSTETEIRWPESIAPYSVCVIAPKVNILLRKTNYTQNIQRYSLVILLNHLDVIISILTWFFVCVLER